MVIPSLLWKRGRACTLPSGGYLPWHHPAAVLWDHQERPFLWFCVICTPCLLHQPSGCSVLCVGACAGVCTLSHSDACSTCALTLAKSTPRKVTMTSWPCRVALSVMLTGASGSAVVGASGCAGGGWLGGSAWLVAGASSLALVSSCARLAIAALRRCLQKPCGALAKSLHSHVPLHTTYCVVPLLWLATVAVPSDNSSTSPLRTMATALSTRPLHSVSLAFAFSAIAATASRQAARAPKSGEETSSQENSFTATIKMTSIK